jgi:hypothetical protein
MLIRYTDVIALGAAVVTVLLVRRFAPGRIPRRALLWWLGPVLLAGLLVVGWDRLVYGGALATGYASGVVTFGLGALSGNLKNTPWKLTTTMPAFWFALAGLVWLWRAASGCAAPLRSASCGRPEPSPTATSPSPRR